jgi:DUF1680 family protein
VTRRLSHQASPARRAVLQAIAVAPWLSAAALAESARSAGRDATPRAVEPVALCDVRLLPGPFQAAQELDGRYLLSLNPERLLHNFRVNAGLEPRAPVYGGWESQEPWVDIRCHGHTLGHYLSACAMMSAATGSVSCRERVRATVEGLKACQDASPDGLVTAFPDHAEQLRNALAGRSVVGVPWYTMHKVMAGLRDAHVFAQDPAALGVLRRLADWVDDAARDCPPDRFQRMLDVEHGGMNEVLADLHALTGEPRYLALAQRFDHQALLVPLADGRDTLDGLHSNTQIPKVVGFARLHELTGQDRYRRAAEFFWRTVVDGRSYATGGNGDVEHFFPRDGFRARLGSAKTMETCSTHNMLRLTRSLFMARPSVAYADYYERALINGILASQDPDSGMVTYFQATRPGYPKLYCTPEHSFWCCTGTGMENHAKYGDSIYFQDADGLYVNLFIASEFDWRSRGVHVRQATAFPDEAQTRLTIQAAAPTRFALRIRHPSWCRRAVVEVNGRAASVSTEPGRFIEIDRTWRTGDTIEVRVPMHLHLQPLPGAPDVAAVMFGPLVLAARLGRDGMRPGDDLIVNERTYGDVLDRPMPLPEADLREDSLDAILKRNPGRGPSFTLRATRPEADLELVPFHRIAHERYSLYWQLPSVAPSRA